MNTTTQSEIDRFAQRFVQRYWETLKSGAFPMPPNEPVEETPVELLAEVSHQTQYEPSSKDEPALCRLRMESTLGAWWLFSFRRNSDSWELVGCSARSDDNERPHDLLGPVYASHFEPFLRHVTDMANNGESIR
jgi:hypothetical protein